MPPARATKDAIYKKMKKPQYASKAPKTTAAVKRATTRLKKKVVAARKRY